MPTHRSSESRTRSAARSCVFALLTFAACDKPPAANGSVLSAASPSASAQTVAVPATSPSAQTVALPATSPSAPSSSGAAPSGTPAGSADLAPPDTIIAQHVLVVYKGAKRAPKGVTRTKVEARTRAEEALEKIRSGVAFEDVVKAYSDDTGSVDRMGSLGKFHKGDMDPTFAGAAFALKVGQVSDVVQTPFGFHVIKRTQ